MAPNRRQQDTALSVHKQLPEAQKVERLVAIVRAVIMGLVEREEDVDIRTHSNERRVMITVRVHEKDMPFALGAHGNNANALRQILLGVAKKLDFRFDLDIMKPSGDIDWSSR